MWLLEKDCLPLLWDFGYAINTNQSNFDNNLEKLYASYVLQFDINFYHIPRITRWVNIF